MDTAALKDIGLTKGEINVYLALLKLGLSSTGPIAQESGVSRSKLYPILDKLGRKGLAGHIVKGKVKHFEAMPPKHILEYIDERSRKYEEQRALVQKMLPQLERSRQKEATQATLYEGLKAIKNFYNGMLDELSAGDTYQVIGASYGEEKPGVRSFFENYHSRRAKKKVKVRMLVNADTRNLVPSTMRNADVRFLPQYLVSNMIIVIYRNKTFLFFLSDEPVGFLIENKEITAAFRTYFETFWKIAEK